MNKYSDTELQLLNDLHLGRSITISKNQYRRIRTGISPILRAKTDQAMGWK